MRAFLAGAALRLQLAATMLLSGRGAYRAGDTDRTSADWRPRKQRADDAWLPVADLVNARTRDIVRNEAYASSAVEAFDRNVVGCGLTAMPCRTQDDGTLDERWNEEAQALFELWAEDATLVDRERKRSFADVQSWALTEAVTMGGGLVVLCEEDRGPGLPTLCLQVFEYEQLDRTITRHEHAPGKFHEVRAGVEIDQYGAAVAYHLAGVREEPGATHYAGFGRSERIPAERVLHVFEPARSRQTLSEGRFASSLQRIRNLHAYDRSTLLAARLEASVGLVVKLDDPVSPLSSKPAEEGGEEGGEAEAGEKPDELESSPINIFRLNPNESAQPFIPSRPGGGYRDFIATQVRAFAAGVGLSYELVARDFTGGSYSSQRQSMLEDRREFRKLQKMLAGKLCSPVFREFVVLAVRDGLLRAPLREFARTPRRWQAVSWMSDGWEWIDQEKEAKAMQIALQNRLTTRQEILAQRGRKWQTVAKQLKAEADFDQQVGLPALQLTNPTQVTATPPAEDTNAAA